MIALATLNGPMPKLGVVLVALMAGGALLLSPPRLRAWAMLGALVLAPVLLLADIWHSPQLHIVHHHPLLALVGAAAGLALVIAVAVGLNRRPWLLAPLAVIALPFRVPVQSGGTTSNLLIPLYLVVAAGSLAVIAPALGWFSEPVEEVGRGDRERELDRVHRRTSRYEMPHREHLTERLSAPPARWLERLLLLSVVLYAVQAMYSKDFEKALQQMVFFYVPFALLFSLLRRMEWTRRW